MLEKVVLSNNLTASIDGKIIPEKYQALLVIDHSGRKAPIIKVMQPINGDHWSPTGGSWYYETLKVSTKSRDDLSIDWGKNWSIESGMQTALKRATQYLEEPDDGVREGWSRSFTVASVTAAKLKLANIFVELTGTDPGDNQAYAEFSREAEGFLTDWLQKRDQNGGGER
tara:strand:- start:141 stop:650 length:510 start_codon:yes stop_codon:yes gene_type:complete